MSLLQSFQLNSGGLIWSSLCWQNKCQICILGYVENVVMLSVIFHDLASLVFRQ